MMTVYGLGRYPFHCATMDGSIKHLETIDIYSFSQRSVESIDSQEVTITCVLWLLAAG